jgi:Aerotolerance regulator N-terminal/von Willebrand factor type A domain
MAFLNPALLWGLALTSIPIIIHLLQRRRYRVVRWGAMEFLRLSVKKRSRRLRIEQLLLLLVRCLVIALVALALCRPALRPGALQALASESHVYALIVLDNSYSMGYQPEGAERETLFDRAKRRAADLIRGGLRQGDAVSVVLAGDPPQALIRKPSYDLEGAAASVNRLSLSDRATNFTRAARLCLDILTEYRSSSPGNPEIYFITDSQALGWEANRDPDVWEQLVRRQKARLSVMMVGEGNEENLAVTGVQLARGLVTARAAAQLRARIANYSARPARSLLATLEVDGQAAESARVDIQPGQESALSFTHIFDRGGVHTAAVRIAPDRLPRDNVGYLSLRVREAVRVMILNGHPDADLRKDAGGFLEVAMKPPTAGPGSEATSLEPVTVAGSTLGSADLRSYDVVTLSDVTMLGDADRRALAQFVQGGGGVLIFPGSQVNTTLYNRDLFDASPSLLPARLSGPVDLPGKLHLDASSMDHPALQRFRGATDVEIGTAEFTRAFTLQPKENDPAVRVLARFNSGQPALVEKRFGLGKVLLFAAGVSLEWSDLPVHPVFLPLVHQLVTYLAEGAGGTRNATVGEPLVKPLPLSDATKKVTLTTPSGATSVLKPVIDERGCTVSVERTAEAGFYRIAVDGTPAPDTMAVNLPAKESNLRALDEAAVANLLPGVHWTWVRPSESIEAAVRRSRLGIELWRPLLFAALIFMLIETALAQLFGRRA